MENYGPNITKLRRQRGPKAEQQKKKRHAWKAIQAFPGRHALLPVSLISWDDPKDPIARCCIPSIGEN